ncbi:MAG: GH92 family glycosyl hydrolase [Rikenellaceae bacterium]
MLYKTVFGAFALALSLSLTSCGGDTTSNVDYVDPTIGNVVPFLVPTFPTIQQPNQMLRLFPHKADYISDELKGLPLQTVTHRVAGVFPMIASSSDNEDWSRPMIIDHDLEIYHPWFYSTYLIEDDIRIKVAPGEKGAIFSFDFCGDGENKLFIKASEEATMECEDSTFAFTERYNYSSKGLTATTRSMSIYAYGVFTTADGEPISPKVTPKSGGVEFDFEQESISVRYAISYIDMAQAEANYNRESLSTITMDALAQIAKQRWADRLDQIQVTGGTEAQKRTFYTSLYRTYERMININESGRYFSGYDGKVHESDRPFYVDDWTWDTYRAQHPLRTILTPTMEGDMLNSYVKMYEQSGWLPTFPQVHGNHVCMNSYHSAPLFIDAYRKGVKGFDIESAYAGIKKNLTEATYIPWRQHAPRRPIDEFFIKEGYFPAVALGEKENEPEVDSFEKRQAISVSLGVSYDFWCMTELANELGHKSDYEKYKYLTTSYKTLWHPKKRLFVPRDESGEFLNINPKRDGGKGYREYYDENNGWTYAWDVPHDISGLIGLLGDKESAEARLDQLFREPLDMPKAEFYWNGANSTGLVGQFSMGNEPSFHIPYLYNYFGAAWKTQQKTRFLLDVWFKDNIFGMPGDEDGGGMTAFVVLSSLGIYQVTPGVPVYSITSPIFESSEIALENGNTFTIKAEGASRTNKYIQSAKLNGKPLNTPFITHEQIIEGATLELILGELPNKNWGDN